MLVSMAPCCWNVPWLLGWFVVARGDQVGHQVVLVWVGCWVWWLLGCSMVGKKGGGCDITPHPRFMVPMKAVWGVPCLMQVWLILLLGGAYKGNAHFDLLVVCFWV